MTTYRKYNWPELFDAFEQSALTQAEFCQQHNINPKYFNVKWNQHRHETHEPTGFTRVQIASPRHSAFTASQVVIEHGQCKIHCPDSMTPSDVANLVRLLA